MTKVYIMLTWAPTGGTALYVTDVDAQTEPERAAFEVITNWQWRYAYPGVGWIRESVIPSGGPVPHPYSKRRLGNAKQLARHAIKIMDRLAKIEAEFIAHPGSPEPFTDDANPLEMFASMEAALDKINYGEVEIGTSTGEEGTP
jgi:hypothetical protein